MPPKPAQRRADRAVQELHALPPYNTVEKVPCPEQKQPRQKGEIIRRIEPPRIKSKVRCNVVCIQCLRQPKAQTAKTQIAHRNIAGQGKQHCGDSKPCCGWNAPQRLFQKAGQQHSAAQQGQHTKNDPVLRHKKQRDRRDKRPCPKHLCAPAQGMMPQLHTEAGQQNEHPADALLPQMPGQVIIPVGLNAEQIDQIPAAVIEHHADQIQPAQLVQKGVAARSVTVLHGVFLPFCHAVTPFSGAAGSWAAVPGWAWCIFPWREGCFPPAPLLRFQSIPG